MSVTQEKYNVNKVSSPTARKVTTHQDNENQLDEKLANRTEAQSHYP